MAVIFFGTVDYYCELLWTTVWKYSLLTEQSWLIPIYIYPGYNLTYIIHSIGQYYHIYREMIDISQPVSLSLLVLDLIDLEDLCSIVVKKSQCVHGQ